MSKAEGAIRCQVQMQNSADCLGSIALQVPHRAV